MKKLNQTITLLFFTIISFVAKAQDSLYVYKNGTIITKYKLSEIDSITFKNNELPQTVSDINGNVYNTVKIGSQTWMSENLKATSYNDGTVIHNVTNNDLWAQISLGAYCWYNNDIAYKDTYGALYNWHSIEQNKLCPQGWHVPSDQEWKTLEITLGMTESLANLSGWRGNSEGNMLKAITRWNSDGNGTDTWGFKALPAGIRYGNIGMAGQNGVFSDIGNSASWWSSDAYTRYIGFNRTDIARNQDSKEFGFCIRCIKNDE